jgi:ribosomal protein L7Ae-like RNA K-turn-binding protein
MMKKLLIIVGMSLALVGCATVSDSGTAAAPASPAAVAPSAAAAAPASETSSAVAAQDPLFAPKEGVAVVYVFRNSSLGMAVGMNVALDGEKIGRTGAKRYIRTEVQPGSHTISCKSETVSEVTFDAEAGKVYYVWQQIKMGAFIARNNLQLVDEATGQKGVKQCKPVETEAVN